MFYQEFQFNFTLADGKVDFITGVNYFNEDSGSPRESLINAIGSSNYANNATGGAANGNLWGCNDTLGVPCAGAVRRLRRTGDSITTQESTAYGLFANTTIHFGERVNLTLGARESNDEKVFSNELFASDNFIPQFGGSTVVSAEDDWSATDYRATVDFNITDDFMLYVTSSRAFRSGSLQRARTRFDNAARACSPYHRRPQPALVPPETLLNDEIGFRSEWLDGRLRFNATYYEMDYTDRQGASAVADATTPTGFRIDLVNQGDVDSLGLGGRSDVRRHGALHDRRRHGPRELRDVEPLHQQRPVPVPAADGSRAHPDRTIRSAESDGQFLVLAELYEDGNDADPSGWLHAAELASITCFATPAAAVFPSTFIDSRYEVPSYNLANCRCATRPTTANGRRRCSRTT